jgi:hypothetical protein
VAREPKAEWPVAALVIVFAALGAWLYAPQLAKLDLLCGLGCLVGASLSMVGYARGADSHTRRLSVLGLGASLVGLGLLALFYAG